MLGCGLMIKRLQGSRFFGYWWVMPPCGVWLVGYLTRSWPWGGAGMLLNRYELFFDGKHDLKGVMIRTSYFFQGPVSSYLQVSVKNMIKNLV